MQTRQVCCPVEGMHPTLTLRRQPQVPFRSVGGSMTDMIRCRYISSDRHMYARDLRATRMERSS